MLLEKVLVVENVCLLEYSSTAFGCISQHLTILFISLSTYIHTHTGKTHGAPKDDPSLRMVGDLGNIQADEMGVATVKLENKALKIYGPHSVIGRSIIVCAGQDDQGRGGQETSLTTGNAGPRIAYGVIGIANPSTS
jgi:Cu/Zn superoxide dismutase